MPRINLTTQETAEIIARDELENKEHGYVGIRFCDLSDKKQEQVAKYIKLKSSIYSVKNLPKEEILKSLKMTNVELLFLPNYLAFSQFPRWREKRVSRMAYLCCCRKPTEAVRQQILAAI